MSATAAVTLSYALDPPSEITAAPTSKAGSSLATPAAQTLSYPLAPLTSTSYSIYYSDLSTLVLQAQKELNESLTVWKDAIGDKEKHKEDPGKVGYGKGKAARAMQYAKGDAKAEPGAELGEGEEEDVDEDEE